MAGENSILPFLHATPAWQIACQIGTLLLQQCNSVLFCDKASIGVRHRSDGTSWLVSGSSPTMKHGPDAIQSDADPRSATFADFGAEILQQALDVLPGYILMAGLLLAPGSRRCAAPLLLAADQCGHRSVLSVPVVCISS